MQLSLSNDEEKAICALGELKLFPFRFIDLREKGPDLDKLTAALKKSLRIEVLRRIPRKLSYGCFESLKIP